MLRIALCDDEPLFLQKLHRFLVSRFKSENEAILIDEYSSSAVLASCLTEKTYDIFFLDIEMPDLDGMALAEKIRKQFPWAILIFLTSHSEFAPDGYRVQALRFCSKLNQEQLEEAVSAAIQEFRKLDKRSLAVANRGNLNLIPHRDILYAHHALRHTDLYTVSQGIVQDSRGIQSVFDQISSERFLFLDRSTFFNLDYLQRIEDGRVILRNGESLAVSRRLLPRVKLEVLRVLGG